MHSLLLCRMPAFALVREGFILFVLVYALGGVFVELM